MRSSKAQTSRSQMHENASRPVGNGQPGTSRTRDILIALGVSSLAFAIRLGHLLSLRESPFFDLLPGGDSFTYYEWGKTIAGGEWLGTEVFYQAPLYPYFLGLVSSLGAPGLWEIRLVQALLGSMACGMLALAATRWFSSSWVGLIAGGLLALYAPAIFHDALIQKSVLDLFLLCLLLWILSANPDRSRLGLHFVAGLTLGAMILTRENAALLGLAIGAWIFLARPARARFRWTRLAVFSGAVLLALSPVALRNWSVGDEFHLTTSQLGSNLYIGNNPRANGTYESLVWGRGDASVESTDARVLAEEELGRPLSPGEISDFWTTQALDYIHSDPLDWLQLLGLKFLLSWNAIELIDTEDQYSHARFSPILAASGTLLHFGILAPLALLGAIVTWSQRDRLWLLYALLGAYTLALLAFYVVARYRLPLVPLLLPFAAAALVKGPGWFRDRASRHKGVLVTAGIATAGVAILAHLPMIQKEGMEAAHAFNLGIAQRRAGNTAAAIESFQRSVALVPRYAEAHTALANTLSQADRFTESFEHFRAAIAADPDVAGIHHDQGLAFSRSGDLESSEQAFAEAIRIDPLLASAHFYRGLSLLRIGEATQAASAIEEAIRLEPDLRLRLRHAAWLHATSSEAPESSTAERALQMARWAVRFGGQKDPESLSTLAAALASTDRFPRALRAADAAVALARQNENPIEISVMKARYDQIAKHRRIRR